MRYFLLLLVSGCGLGLPSEGEVYEQSEGRGLVEVIETGRCGEVKSAIRRIAMADSTSIAFMINAGGSFKGGSVRPTTILEGSYDMQGTCIAVKPTREASGRQEDGSVFVQGRPAWYRIEPVDDFSHKYARVSE